VSVRKRARRTRENALGLAKTVVAVAREEQVTLVAASLAYYLFLALVPLVLFAIIGLSLVDGDLLEQLLGIASGTVLPKDTSIPVDDLTRTGGRLRAAGLGAAILAWSALRMFGALDGAFAAVYGERAQVSLAGKLADAALVLLTVALAATALAGVGAALALVISDRVLLRLFSPVFVFATLAVVFLPIYRVLPEADVTVREALPGTLLAAAAWTLSGVIVRLYATVSGSVHVYGIVGGLLLVFTWLYAGGLVLVVGAALNATLAGRVDPDAEWIPTGYT
jgi:membrane protein